MEHETASVLIWLIEDTRARDVTTLSTNLDLYDHARKYENAKASRLVIRLQLFRRTNDD